MVAITSLSGPVAWMSTWVSSMIEEVSRLSVVIEAVVPEAIRSPASDGDGAGDRDTCGTKSLVHGLCGRWSWTDAALSRMGVPGWAFGVMFPSVFATGLVSVVWSLLPIVPNLPSPSTRTGGDLRRSWRRELLDLSDSSAESLLRRLRR